MDNSVLLNLYSGNKADKLTSRQLTIEEGKSEKGLASMVKGQLVKGTVVSVGDSITLNFSGQVVSVLRSVLSNVSVGDEKTFEVMNATDNEIVLKLLGECENSRQLIKAVKEPDSNWESILAKKEKATKQANKEAQYKETKTKLEEIAAKLTEQDLRLLEAEGFSAQSFSVEALYSVLNRIKAEASQTQKTLGQGIAGTGIDQNTSQKNLVGLGLKESNLPVTDENISKLTKVLDLSTIVSKMDDKAMSYLISQEAEPSIQNIYKAIYSGTAQKTETLSNQAWSELGSQVKEVIASAGYEVTEDNLGEAKWLLENKLPLTEETFTYKKNLENLKSGFNAGTTIDTLLQGMQNGISPMNVSLLTYDIASAEHIVSGLQMISPEAVTKAVRTGTELTIKNLTAIQKSLPEQDSKEIAETEEAVIGDFTEADVEELLKEDAATEAGGAGRAVFTGVNNSDSTNSSGSEQESAGTRYEEIRAKRQLEEIRLKMTLEAAGELEKKGIKVETERLSKVVDALKELEDDYYRQYLREADLEVSDASLQTLKETTSSIELLKYAPSYVLGSTLAEAGTQTIPSLLAEGSSLQAKLDKAGLAYETLATVPNREYGDSIQKAFANMDSLLNELGIESTAENQRAVRILAYNQMNITEENINQIKAYDLQVNTLINNLHPEVTVRMIREGRNPLGMTMTELNQTIDRIKEEQGISSEEKYSTYLRQLEKSDSITAEERKAYIGVYRLLYNIEKSDGAVLGSVVKAGQEVTLDHLLTALQTSKKGRLDAVINDEFGTLQSMTREKETIAQQLSGFSSEAGQQEESQSSKEDMLRQQTEYLDRILKQVKEELTPDKLATVEQEIIRQTAAEQTAASQQNASSSSQSAFTSQQQLLQSGIWEAVKDIPVEKLLAALQNTESQGQTDDELYTQKVQEIRELCKSSEQSIRFLNDYQVPTTPANLMMASQVLSNGESPIKRLLKQQDEKNLEKSENGIKEMNHLSDTLSNKDSMVDAYAQLEADAKEALTRACSEEKLDSWKLAELKSISQQMSFVKTLAEKEYYQIPIETDRGIMNINLTILRGSQDTGKLSVTVKSEQLGNVKADFSLKESSLKGLITSDSRNGLELLQKNSGLIETVAEESGVSLKQLDYCLQSRDPEIYLYQNPGTSQEAVTMKAETERTLYRIAKAVVQTVQAAENSGSDIDRAVS